MEQPPSSLPISRSSTNTALLPGPTNLQAATWILQGVLKVVSVGQGQARANAGFEGRFGWARPDTGRLQRVFRRRPQTDVVQNQETWFALFRSTPRPKSRQTEDHVASLLHLLLVHPL